jgi:tetratricopeptide (TPR) repeat protein
MIFLAITGFLTFLIFLALGLLALPATAALDKALGKEKGLLLYCVALLALTFLGMRPSGPVGRTPRAKAEKDVPAEPLVRKGDPFARAELAHGDVRNLFEPYSDTQPLPPVSLDTPPWVALPFSLPPTIPGPAPGHRAVLRGARLACQAEQTSSIPEIPAATFSDYQPKPEDVYDWVLNTGKPYYVYILAIRDGNGTWHREGTAGYEHLKWVLANAGEGFEKLSVRYAMVGFDAQARKKGLRAVDVLKARTQNKVEKAAREQDGGWFLRRTVANLYHEALARAGVNPFADLSKDKDPDALRRAAREMAEVGRTGKEGGAGWVKASELVEAALPEIRANRGPQELSEALLQLLEAYRAQRDEQAVLRTLAEYMRTAPQSAQAPTWLGQLHLVGMDLPREALRYFQAALDRNGRYEPALIGEGDAYTLAGRPEDALRAYSLVTGDEGLTRKAAAQLRLGRLDDARGSAESVLSRTPSDLGATLVRACVLYTQGDLANARTGFEAVATSPDGDALRAQACYDLGLTCLRMKQTKAALDAFAACEKALSLGSDPGPTPDETVSPSLGRALVAFATGDEETMRTQLDKARQEAPRSSYLDMLSGMIASLEGNDASAVRALDAALRKAPRYAELDGWLGKTYLHLGSRAASTGGAAADVAETFARAVAFAHRAAERAASNDKNAYEARLREVLVRLGDENLPTKQRYGLARAAAMEVLDNSALREQPVALALAGYCAYQLGDYEECIRKFQAVLDVLPADKEDAPWAAWRTYAETQLRAVKHWLSLEEKQVRFEGLSLGKPWETGQNNGPHLRIEDGKLIIEGRTTRDGRFDDPTVYAWNDTLFRRDTFESLTLRLRIPREERGKTTNNVTFGVQLVAASGRGSAKRPGIGVFYDRNKVAVRIHGGQIKRYKTGDVTRLDPSVDWPAGDEVVVRIVREDPERGTVAVYLNDTLVVRDNVSTFRSSRGKASLWFVGYSTRAQDFKVQIEDVRIVRRKSP